jgi:hypothetical protein
VARRRRGTVKIYNGQFRSIKGLDKIQRMLADLPGDIVQKVQPAIDQGAEEVAAKIRAIAPVSNDRETTPGSLRASVHTEPGDYELQRVVMVDDKDQDGKFYAKHVEHGHRTPSGKHVQGKPFFYPALRVTKKRVRNRISRAINKAVKEAK